MTSPDFHSIAFLAFVAEAELVGGWPDSNAVKRRAYAMYEEALKERDAERDKLLES